MSTSREGTGSLQELVDDQVRAGRVPGAVALVARRAGDDHEDVSVGVAGERMIGGATMTRDSRFRIASLTKPILAATAMVLVERGRLGLDEEISPWVPELAEPMVQRTPDAAVDDVTPAARPITVRHLLAGQGGHGFPADMSSPIAARLAEELHQGPTRPEAFLEPDVWLAQLATVPLLHQPGEGWTYNTGFDILGVLLERLEGADLGEILRDTVLGPLGMDRTSFHIDPPDVATMTGLYARDEEGERLLVDPPEGQGTSPPRFRSGAGGLVSTADDWLTFGRMLLAGGLGPSGRVVSVQGVVTMTSPQARAEPDNPFLDGQAWGFGGSVDVTDSEPWTVPGRFGWVGGTGTAGYVIPSSRTAVVWMSQVELSGPDDFAAMADVLTWTAQLAHGRG